MGLGGGCKFVILPLFQKKGGTPPPGYWPEKNVYYIYLDITEEDAMSFRLGILDGADYTSTAVGTLIRCTLILSWNKDDILSCL